MKFDLLAELKKRDVVEKMNYMTEHPDYLIGGGTGYWHVLRKSPMKIIV